MLDKTEEEWKKELAPEVFEILRNKGTERPFTGKYDKFNEAGTYYCAGCEAKLFTDEGKFDSGCGWPAFHTPIDDKNIKYEMDESHGMKRVEIMCANCGGHLGHVFNDGPVGKGYRYCVNSLSLNFKNKEEEK